MKGISNTIDFLAKFRFPPRALACIAQHLDHDFMNHPPVVEVGEHEDLDAIAHQVFEQLSDQKIKSLEDILSPNKEFHHACQQLIYTYVIQDYSREITYRKKDVTVIIRALVAIVLSVTMQMNLIVPR